MTDLLEKAVAWLRAQRKAHLGRTVTYVRGAVNYHEEISFDVTATVGETRFRIGQGPGPDVLVRTRDYLIEAADLAAGGIPEPAAGDQIRETRGETVYVQEVMGPGNDEPEWRWSDRYGGTLRIHTKEVGTEAVP